MFEFCFENTTTIGGRWTKTAKLSNRTQRTKENNNPQPLLTKQLDAHSPPTSIGIRIDVIWNTIVITVQQIIGVGIRR
jgi:hypothetical protein